MKKNRINIRLFIIGLLIFGLIVIGFVFLEISQSKEELLIIMENESITLVNSLSNSIENSIITNNEIEGLIIDKLLITGRSVGNRKIRPGKDKDLMKSIVRESNISHISLLNDKLELICSNDSVINTKFNIYDEEEIKNILLREKYIDFGIQLNPISNREMYLIAVKSGNGNIVLSGLDVDEIIEFRKRIGIGRQIIDIAANKDIVYAALQDTLGIVSASGGISEMIPIENDKFLMSAWSDNKIRSRVIEYNGEKILEVVQPISINDGRKLLTRIALSLEKIRDIQQRSMRRAIIIGVGIFLLSVLVFYFLITREKYADLKRAHERHKIYTSSILGGITDAVIAIDSEGKIVVFNEAARKIFGIINDLPEPDDYSLYFPNDELKIMRCFSTGMNEKFFEIEFKTEDQKIKMLGCSISILKDENGAVETGIAIIRDLTIRKKLDEQLHRKDKLSALGELAAGVAHEIRNPLNAIHVIAQRFQMEFEASEDNDEFQKLSKTVRTEVSRVNNIIRQFLDFARPAPLNTGICDLSEIMKETVSLLESKAVVQNVELVNVSNERSMVKADREKLKQAFINIMQNAIEALPEGGIIEYGIKNINAKAEIKIKDNGGGIPIEIRDKIFNLYFTSKPTGTGLGLSIVHQIINEHDGEISFNCPEDGGTEFTIILNGS